MLFYTTPTLQEYIYQKTYKALVRLFIVNNLKIYGYSDTYASWFANSNNIPFVNVACICNGCGQPLSSEEIIVNKGYEATCTEEGLSDGTRCPLCDAVLEEQISIPAKGHRREKVKGTPPTCTESGLTYGIHCPDCGEIFKAQEIIPATGHTVVEDKGYPVTCTEKGLSDGSHCSICGDIIIEQVVIPATGHTVVEDIGYAATCTENGLSDGSHCSVCHEIIQAQE